jgi:hypothetical protein
MWTLLDMEGSEDAETEIINDPLDSSSDLGEISDPQE